MTPAAEIDAQAYLARVLYRVLPRVGYMIRSETVQRLAQELHREGVAVKPRPTPATR